MEERAITLIDEKTGEQAKLPVLVGTENTTTIDIRTLPKQLGMYTFDPGFVATASCRSSITYINGMTGTLRYRGYPIEQLAEKSSHLESAYLLLNGELPSATELANFKKVTADYSTSIPEGLKNICKGLPKDAHPMATVMSLLSGLASYYPEKMDIQNQETRTAAIHQLIGQIPVLAAMAYRHRQGLDFIDSNPELSYSANFLNMLFGPDSENAQSELFAEALDVMFLLHADHEQNASTSTVRLAGSSGTHPFAAIAAGVASLWGPSHGGANEAVIRMLEDITESDNTIEHFINRAKDKSDSYRLMGFGHRVYKNFDPRAKIISKFADQLLDSMGATDTPLFDTARSLGKIALEDDYFVSRKLYPNVDFYSGIILRRVGIPMEMFTVLFALARTVGWLSHWNEMYNDEDFRIGRPRQLYMGSTSRDYQNTDNR